MIWTLTKYFICYMVLVFALYNNLVEYTGVSEYSLWRIPLAIACAMSSSFICDKLDKIGGEK
mgnify:CR=1 FL=1